RHVPGPPEGSLHQSVLASRGRYITYLSGDCIWAPSLLTELVAALESADVAHVQVARLQPGGTLEIDPVDLTTPDHRAALCRGELSLPPGAWAFTRESYERLPHPLPRSRRVEALGSDVLRTYAATSEMGIGRRLGIHLLHFPSDSRSG